MPFCFIFGVVIVIFGVGGSSVAFVCIVFVVGSGECFLLLVVVVPLLLFSFASLYFFVVVFVFLGIFKCTSFHSFTFILSINYLVSFL